MGQGSKFGSTNAYDGSGSRKGENDYFAKNQFVKIEDAYLDALDFLNDQLHQLGGEQTSQTLDGTNVTRGEALRVKLPQVNLPEFSGKYNDWENFRDLFNALIIQNERLENVTRLHYLKTALRCEAAQLLKHIPITNANFLIAWETLTTRYDNNRALINAHIQSFMEIPRVNNNSVEDLKLLRDTTNEVLQALNNLHRPVSEWSDLIVFIVTSKLDSPTLKEWEMQLGSSLEYPNYNKLDEFLITRIRALEAIQTVRNSSEKSKFSKTNSVKGHTASTNSKCPLCKESHNLYKCSQFKSLSVERRKEIAQSNNCCFNCLIPGHRPYSCSSKFTCAKCRLKHNTLLHIEKRVDSNQSSLSVTNSQTVVNSPSTSDQSDQSTVNANHVSIDNETVICILNSQTGNIACTLLATALVEVRVDSGKIHKFKVLMDQGSESCFASERAVSILNPHYEKINALVYGVGGASVGSVKKLAKFQFLSKEQGCKNLTVQALVLPKLTAYYPPTKPKNYDDTEFKNISLADPSFFEDSPIDFILGADKFGACLLPGLKQGVAGNLTAQATIFGWIISGSISSVSRPIYSLSAHNCVSIGALHDNLEKFWQLEELPVASSLTENQKRCEQHFIDTYQRLDSGRYMVRYPFDDGPPISIGNSFDKCRVILDRVLKRLLKIPLILKQYKAFIAEYEELGHMRPVKLDSFSDSNQVVYLPHHCVIRESSSTTKLRVVFNASSLTSNNTSLNSHSLVGPSLLNDIVSILLRWRIHRYVLVADVEKMFRQILIDPRDIDYQRILWRNENNELIAYQLLTVTYGTACAPFLANRVVKQLIIDEGPNFPLAHSVLDGNIYVDDAFIGADDKDTAKQTKEQSLNLMEKGGFHLRKWASNSPDLLRDCAENNHERALALNAPEDEELKVLGLKWDPVSDSFCFSIELNSVDVPTKRVVLSCIAKLYDPLGWLSPVVVKAKLLMQELWLRKIDWDEKLPQDLLLQWFEYYYDLSTLVELKIPRWIGSIASSSHCELHGFSDASNRAYAANVYLRVLDKNNEVHITLLLSKS